MLVAETMRASTCTGLSAPTRVTWPVCSTPSSFACSGKVRLPISSRNSVPPGGDLEPSGAVFLRVGERALLVAEELRLEQRLGDRAQVDVHERLAGARRRAMDGARDQFLAGAVLAEDQHRRVGARDLLDVAEQAAAIAGELADDLARRARRGSG